MNIIIRPPSLQDGAAITRLVKESQTLDVNSSYLYFLLSDHFSQTCAIAEVDNTAVGFVTAYRLPIDPNVLFVWQVAVDASMRGQGLAMQLLQNLTERDWFTQINKVQCTISPSNQASNALFAKFAQQLDSKVEISDYLTSVHLGNGHEAEPLVSISLTK
ncbi:diaminobutyrate acetyltransferase [Thiomicrospira sp. R3]|uniref:diaminobutyrate acetyltransferase n=1 Tax=Thiomicrospira sp. R3 TaxID=3035472 RepID=UPI00259BEA85|nr:diaminobutyrate acetyltransferase [Thiomicrospira sp. R3]WFE68538.1 diaminobutyrate acetyltransferase [Thiomicrospira sp. R3]